jgi:hypothetical protein
MSLFGDERYQWRETYFILFRNSDRPSAEEVSQALAGDHRFEVSNVVADSSGRFDTLTLRSPDDFSAMDVSYVSGDEVKEQVRELLGDLAKTTLSEEERTLLDQLGDCDARLDVFHFEQLQGDEDDDFLDPGALLIVLERLTKLCHGVGIDPQSGSLMS